MPLAPLLLLAATAPAADPSTADHLAKPVIGVRQSVHEVIEYAEGKIPRLTPPNTAAEWDATAARLRADVLAKVVFRGEAAKWRELPPKVEYLGEAPGGPGYKVKKLRFEAAPWMWIPALLYEPEKLAGKVPAVMNVNGHDALGKAAKYKQIRCINQAKRGMLALNVEWVGMGQLKTDGFSHARMNQLDLCGTAGVAPFYLNLSRGLDALLAHPHADPKRVAVTGLSGGAWQTITISALDPRVTLTNPVAGYSSFLTRTRHPKDLGDSEQTPCDLATVADYAHLTAMMAPRPTLLTFNAADNCCFEAGYAMPPLLRAAGPVFALYGKGDALRSHVNHVPGTHNYEQDNREANYRMLGDFFFPGDKGYERKEIPSDAEVRSPAELQVPLPDGNQDFNTLARKLMADLPRDAAPPADAAGRDQWQAKKRAELREVVRFRDYAAVADPAGAEVVGDLTVARWRLRLGADWTVPAVELSRGSPTKSAVLIADGGRAKAAAEADRLLAAGYRVLAVDPLFVGEADPVWPAGEAREPTFKSSWLYALLLAAVGDRPLGLQASQIAAAAGWLKATHGGPPVTVVSVGPRAGLAALVAAAVAPDAVAAADLTDPPGSLKQLIEENRTVIPSPEAFCFGLLAVADVKQLAALVAPRPLTVRQPSARAKAELP